MTLKIMSRVAGSRYAGKKLLFIFSFVLLALGLGFGLTALALDDTGCTKAIPDGYGGTCTDVGTNLDTWLALPANSNKECIKGLCLSAEHSAANWKCCRTKVACTNCVATADCATADKLTETCAETGKVCCKPKCEAANCKESCTGTFTADTSKSATGCTDPKKKACCKTSGSGTTTPPAGGGTTASASIPLAPLSPVGDIDIPTLIGLIIKGVLGIVGSIALLMFVYGGFLMLVSQGDPGKIKKGKDALIWAAAGLVVIFGSYIFVGFILSGLGSDGNSGGGEEPATQVCGQGTLAGYSCMNKDNGTNCVKKLCPGDVNNQCCKPKP